MKRKEKATKKSGKREGPFIWTIERDKACQSLKQEIISNTMASPDPEQEYYLAVEASKKGIGGTLFQLDGISANTEADNSEAHGDRERMIMFIWFRLGVAETCYSNSEREALAVICCIAEIRWKVISSLYAILVNTDHEALRVLLTGLANV